MKVNYLQKNRLRHPYLRQIIILLIIFLFGAIVFYFINANVISIISPIWKTKNAIMIGNVVPPTLNQQTQENRLLELVGRKQILNTVVATVLTYPPQTPYDVIIVDAGSNDSITLGSYVSLPEGPILGVVSEVFPRRAKVRLFSSSGEETNAILERNDVPVTLEGKGGGNFKIVLPRDIAVEKGDRILSRDISSRLLAIVEDINIRPTDSFKEVLAKSPVNIFTLRFVFVTP